LGDRLLSPVRADQEGRTEMKSKKYHVDWHAAPWFLERSSDQELGKWATDPDCYEMEVCAKALAERLAERDGAEVEHRAAVVAKREDLRDNPFDPRKEVSADARHIVKHLWILFVLLGFTIGLLLVMLWASIESRIMYSH